jgi:hypothetical protein
MVKESTLSSITTRSDMKSVSNDLSKKNGFTETKKPPEPKERTVSTNNNPHGREFASVTIACPFHAKVLNGKADWYPAQGQLPLERYLGLHTSEQYALYNTSEHGKLSINKGCTCVLDENQSLAISDEE